MTQTTTQLFLDRTRLGMPSLSLCPSPFHTCLPETPVCLRRDPDSLPRNSFTHYVSAKGLPHTRHTALDREETLANPHAEGTYLPVNPDGYPQLCRHHLSSSLGAVGQETQLPEASTEPPLGVSISLRPCPAPGLPEHPTAFHLLSLSPERSPLFPPLGLSLGDTSSRGLL